MLIFYDCLKSQASFFLSSSGFAPPAVMMRPKLLHIWPEITGRALMFHTESQPFNDLGHRTHSTQRTLSVYTLNRGSTNLSQLFV